MTDAKQKSGKSDAPWKHDSPAVAVGTVVPDSRLKLQTDAHGEIILPHVFRPITIRGVTFKNRLAVSPMYSFCLLFRVRLTP
jgi:hypothetical protein